MKKRVIEILTLNDSGVLNRITELFFSRGYSINSLLSCETEEEGKFKIYVELTYEKERVAFIVKLLNKLIDIVEVKDITEDVHVERQAILIKVKEIPEGDIRRLLEEYRLNLIDIREGAYYLEAHCSEERVESLLSKLREAGDIEYLRPGRLFLR